MIEESHGVFARSRVGWAEDKKCLSGVAFLFELQRNERQTTAILRFTSYDDWLFTLHVKCSLSSLLIPRKLIDWLRIHSNHNPTFLGSFSHQTDDSIWESTNSPQKKFLFYLYSNHDDANSFLCLFGKKPILYKVTRRWISFSIMHFLMKSSWEWDAKR